MIKLGDIDVDIKIGSSDAKLYLGDTLVYGGDTPTPPHDYSRDYLTFKTIDSGTFAFSGNSRSAATLSYSVDGGSTWTTVGTATTPTFTADTTIMWKGTIPTSSNGIGTFKSTGRFEVMGNVMSLLAGDNFVGFTDTPDGVFYRFFYNCTGLTSAENLILPETDLTRYRGYRSYTSFFNGCTNLTKAPKLPATKVGELSYSSMFLNCANLTTAPALPATTLGRNCYVQMFSGCTSLTAAPNLPATTLADGCYTNMFNGCTGLTTPPALPATTMVASAYTGMFQGCTSLATAPALPATTLASECYRQMFEGCTSLATAPALPATTLASECYRQMFEGCTSLTTAPELPATTLAFGCYIGMFQGCTSLTTAPDLPATTLGRNCYAQMFSGCTSLNSIKCMAMSTGNTTNWVNGVAATGTFTKASGVTWTTGVDGIPSGWTVVEEEVPIKTPEYLERTANANGYIGLGEEFGENTVIEIDFQMTQAKGYSIIGDKMLSDNDDWRVFLNYDNRANNLLNYDFINSRVDYNTGNWAKRFHLEIGNYYIKDLDNNTMLINSTPKTGFTRGTQMYLFHLDNATQTSTDYGRIYSVKIKQNGTLVKDYVPWTDMNGNYGLYDQVANTIHPSTGQMTGSTVVYDILTP